MNSELGRAIGSFPYVYLCVIVNDFFGGFKLINDILLLQMVNGLHGQHLCNRIKELDGKTAIFFG